MFIRFFRNYLLITLSGLMLTLTSPGKAALGDQIFSPGEEAKLWQSTFVNETKNSNFRIYEFKSHQYQLKQFTNKEGKVFALSWNGLSIPDLKMVLGKYYPFYSNAQFPEQIKHQARRSIQIRTPQLILQSSGLIQYKKGFAYDPNILPSGFNMDFSNDN